MFEQFPVVVGGLAVGICRISIGVRVAVGVLE